MAPAQMMDPGLVVDPIADLHEEDEVVRAQIEPPVGALEIEAAIRWEFTFGVLAPMTPQGEFETVQSAA